MHHVQSRSAIVFALSVTAVVLHVFGFIGNAVSIHQSGQDRSVLEVVGDVVRAFVHSLHPAALTFGLAVVTGYRVDILGGRHVTQSYEIDSSDAT